MSEEMPPNMLLTTNLDPRGHFQPKHQPLGDMSLNHATLIP
jgi:hypothetical protein